MNFDRLAPFYQWMERIAAGGKLQRRRLEFLDRIPTPRKVLLAGEGHGRFLTECVRRFPQAHIVVVDSSARMLEIAEHGESTGGVEFVHADLLEWQPKDAGFDLIVTNFFLDCFPADSLAVVVSNLGQLATPGADWLLADFQIARSGFARWRCRLILWLLYRFFRITCGLTADSLHVPDEALQTAGFIRFEQITADWGLLKSEWWRRGADLHLLERRLENDLASIESSV